MMRFKRALRALDWTLLGEALGALSLFGILYLALVAGAVLQ